MLKEQVVDTIHDIWETNMHQDLNGDRNETEVTVYFTTAPAVEFALEGTECKHTAEDIVCMMLFKNKDWQNPVPFYHTCQYAGPEDRAEIEHCHDILVGETYNTDGMQASEILSSMKVEKTDSDGEAPRYKAHIDIVVLYQQTWDRENENVVKTYLNNMLQTARVDCWGLNKKLEVRIYDIDAYENDEGWHEFDNFLTEFDWDISRKNRPDILKEFADAVRETMKNRQLIHIKGDTDGSTVKIAIAVK